MRIVVFLSIYQKVACNHIEYILDTCVPNTAQDWSNNKVGRRNVSQIFNSQKFPISHLYVYYGVCFVSVFVYQCYECVTFHTVLLYKLYSDVCLFGYQDPLETPLFEKSTCHNSLPCGTFYNGETVFKYTLDLSEWYPIEFGQSVKEVGSFRHPVNKS